MAERIYPVVDNDDGVLVALFTDEAQAILYTRFACLEAGYTYDDLDCDDPDPCPYYIASDPDGSEARGYQPDLYRLTPEQVARTKRPTNKESP